MDEFNCRFCTTKAEMISFCEKHRGKVVVITYHNNMLLGRDQYDEFEVEVNDEGIEKISSFIDNNRDVRSIKIK